ncbi:hypothetical protein HRbin19_01654 [bacterium HR19]|nr:hypothetical protein HRbin19_01654 [bacterium HR19]
MVLGLDLAGSENRKTGVCIADKKVKDVFTVKKDEEIIKVVSEIKNLKVVAIDAPLSLPKGRKNIDEKNSTHFRECDIELMRMKIKFFPITLGPMRMLTKRGIELKRKIESLKNIRVIEVFPGALYDIFKIPRKDKKKIFEFFVKVGFIAEKHERELSQDEFDSIACAFTAKLFLENKTKELGNPSEGTLIIPEPSLFGFI